MAAPTACRQRGRVIRRREVTPPFSEVIREHGGSLWRVTSAYACDGADRDDLYQEICIALWKALPNFRGECSLRTFVHRVARNRGLTHRTRTRRRSAREITLFDGEVLPGMPRVEAGFVERTEAAERDARLREAVRRLPPDLARPIELRLDGLTDTEIGEAMGITANNAGVRLFRARDRLRQTLDPRAFAR